MRSRAIADKPSRLRLTLIRNLQELAGLGQGGGAEAARRQARVCCRSRRVMTAEAHLPLHMHPERLTGSTAAASLV